MTKPAAKGGGGGGASKIFVFETKSSQFGYANSSKWSDYDVPNFSTHERKYKTSVRFDASLSRKRQPSPQTSAPKL